MTINAHNRRWERIESQANYTKSWLSLCYR